MGMAEYMGLCLGHPQHGYYMTRDPFGVKGDFTTAPEISQMFGEMIGVWVADTWIKMGSPSSFILLECGPGRGTLMSDLMRATQKVPNFQEACNIHLIETSPTLKEKQVQLLGQYDPIWHDDLKTLPNNMPVIIIGNEFIDALPVSVLKKTDTGWSEIGVDLDINDTICLHDFKLSDGLLQHTPKLLITPKEGEQVEVSLERFGFVNDLIKIIKKQKGVGLFVDYGFVHNVPGETLQAVKEHKPCNILDYPGEADLTAHVNFAEMSRQLLEEGMIVHGTVSQRFFLTRLGIDHRADVLHQNATKDQSEDIDRALQRLTGENTKAHEMGNLFKVIAFTDDPSIELAGFS